MAAPTSAAAGRPPATHYEVLGVSQSAGPEEIRLAYRQAALRAHPDKVAAGPGPSGKSSGGGSGSGSGIQLQQQQPVAADGDGGAQQAAGPREACSTSTGPGPAAARGEAAAAAAAAAAAGFLEVQRAWEVLQDPQRRREYDRQLALEASRHDMIHINEEVPLSGMGLEEAAEAGSERCFAWPCRCGGQFLLPVEECGDLEVEAVIVPCSTCSLHIQVATGR